MKGGQLDAVILACAGLRRSGLFDDSCMCVIDADELLPAAGQGALSLQCRLDDSRVIDLLAAVNDPVTSMCVETERELVALLNGDCHSPIGALATVEGDRITLRACVGVKGGQPPVVRALAQADTANYLGAAHAVHEQLLTCGAARMLL